MDFIKVVSVYCVMYPKHMLLYLQRRHPEAVELSDMCEETVVAQQVSYSCKENIMNGDHKHVEEGYIHVFVVCALLCDRWVRQPLQQGSLVFLSTLCISAVLFWMRWTRLHLRSCPTVFNKREW